MDLLQLISIFVTAVFISAIATPIVLRFAHQYNLFDLPDHSYETVAGRKIHSRPIPRLGGISILLSFIVCFLIWKAQNSVALGIIYGSLLIFALGIADDILTLSARLRFGLQILIALFTVLYTDLSILHITFYPGLSVHIPVWLGAIVSTFIVVGAVNSLNMIDGLDGLAGGVCIITLTLLSYLYYLLTQDIQTVIHLGIPIIGSVLGFLRYNTHPATIFMGDSGSNWLGFIIGAQLLLVLTAPSGLTSETLNFVPVNFTIVSALMCFAVPILDTAIVIFSRIRAGLPAMSADKRHFHHSLMQLGLSQSQSVTVIYFVCLLAGVLGLMPVLFPRYSLQLVPYIGGFIIAGVIGYSFSFHSKIQLALKFTTRFLTTDVVEDSSRYRVTIRLWERFNKYILFIVLVVSPLFAGEIPVNIGYVALPVTVLLLSTMVLHSRSNDIFEPMAIVLGCATLLAANNQNMLKVEVLHKTFYLQPIYNSLFIVLFFSTIGFLFVTIKRRHLLLNASDFLMLSFPLLLHLLPSSLKAEYLIDVVSIRILIVFLCYRTLERRRIQARRHIKMATLIGLAYLISVSILHLRIVY